MLRSVHAVTTLTYGKITREVQLDEKGEEIFTEALEELITEMRKDFKWRSLHPQTPSNLNETPDQGKIIPKGKKKSNNGKVKK